MCVCVCAGREPGAPQDEAALGEERSAELSALVNNFILRRTNKLLSDHLPPKARGAAQTHMCAFTHICVHSPKPSTLYPACARGCRADTHGQQHCCYHTRCCVGSINCMLSSQLPAITAVRAFPTLKCDAAAACQFTRHWSAVSHHVPKKALQSPKVDL